MYCDILFQCIPENIHVRFYRKKGEKAVATLACDFVDKTFIVTQWCTLHNGPIQNKKKKFVCGWYWVEGGGGVLLGEDLYTIVFVVTDIQRSFLVYC